MSLSMTRETSVHVDASITVALIGAAGLSAASVLSGVTLKVGRGNAKKLGEVQTTMAKVVAQSSTQLDERIDAAVRRVFREQPESIASAIIAEALRDLLDGILEAAQDAPIVITTQEGAT